ncbi:methionine synthase [Sulfoacidibacillus thermotolerans]|uniref:Methionine synthase n=1 Tax=Sulfoacidibacillus thermotolerans TaxID=1765684 RepID=A0A2U3DCK0_SULT2|nr:methionine synthase [Sulfoacidibacillus thermotolerans]PWI58998.1 methionine synthase [Sulfoacidibacillus thermotolerans]
MVAKEHARSAKKPIQERMQEKILILDGAMGTMIQQQNLGAEDFGGELYEGCNEMLNLTRPDLIQEIHEAYLAAGADIIETNTFGATPVVLAEYGLADQTHEINFRAAQIARAAVDKYTTDNWPRYVAGSLGPTTKTLSVTGGATFEQLQEAYYQQARALLMGGVDVLLLETAQDTLNVKAASIGIFQAFDELGKRVPLMVSGTIEPMGTTLAGQNIEAFYISLQHLEPLSVGLNCATGPEFMRDHLRTLSSLAQSAISCYPNAGLPDEDGHYHESPASLAAKMAGFAQQGWLNVAGGCCGTTPEHIRALASALQDYSPRVATASRVPAISGIDPVYIEEDNRPILVGERTNVIGSKKFRRLIANEQYEEASEIARLQVKGGAQVVDVCLADPDRDEMRDMERFLQFAAKKVKAPFMFDSTDAKVLELALKFSQGKAIINSINLEDGEKRFREVVPLIKEYGAAVVVGTIDEQGMAVTRERKLEVARRSYDLLVNHYGLHPTDIIFDPLVFPVATGDANYLGSALETIEGIRLIKEALPHVQTILGVSNVSFGLPQSGREVLNAVFLYHCTKAGLDYAIVNTEKLERYASIPEQERKLAEDLLFATNDETVATFTAFYRTKKEEIKISTNLLSLEERLARYVVEGTKEGLLEDLQTALQTYAPLEIINGPLMTGMEEVGRLFNANELIVAEVLQSAEVMKAAVAFLEPHMEKTETAVKGKIILATVKGDVHDIGKNLVDIILTNNGYQVVNLGIKVPSEQLIAAYQTEKPDVIGLSGLLVKSAQQMILTAQDLKNAGIDVPLLVGGAALTKKFAQTRIAPEYDGVVLYAKDAMEGLELANRLSNPEARMKMIEDLRALLHSDVMQSAPKPKAAQELQKRQVTIHQAPVFTPPDLLRHVLRDYPLSFIAPYLNWQMLLGKHLGLRGNVEKELANGNDKAIMLKQLIDDLLQDALVTGNIRAHAVYQFYPAKADGNQILIYDPYDFSRVLETFDFPRQSGDANLCLADFVRPVTSDEMDYVAFFVVTTGMGIRAQAERLKEQGDYLRSHALQALALELAEAFAERLHHILRDNWGFPDAPELTMRERFIARYQGIRVSFGYPACPNLEDQEKLFQLLRPSEIGVDLTEGYMMDPEATVSALVFSHPEARYFNADA